MIFYYEKLKNYNKIKSDLDNKQLTYFKTKVYNKNNF